jgi:hypothetical protein
MAIPVTDSRNAVRLLADKLDELAGLAAVLMAHAVHTTGDEFTEDEFRKMKADAERIVPDPIGRNAASSPKLQASKNAELLWSLMQELRSSRSSRVPHRRTEA